MRRDRRKAPPPPLQLRSSALVVPSQRTSPSTLKPQTPSPSRLSPVLTSPLPVKHSPLSPVSPARQVLSPGTVSAATTPTSTPRHVGLALVTAIPLTVTATPPTVTATPPTVTTTATQKIPVSLQPSLSTTQSSSVVPSASSTTAPGRVIPPTAIGFVAGVSGVAGALLGVGLFFVFWKRRRAAAGTRRDAGDAN
ncbi:hypothetical protein CCM_02515 [Cordyceps militaris CM01]|uniref:Uncharacterized protein n=1 Tax=Cordyceps militaris (strain CM01) TaxID=983644 RepID=G3JA74_CORMM|nr:uncharacterized protein CCM_02515 [Cordyceps militaris CM01]EGX94244.1 hypothetical protein CCM_02515 [Cordyceps militaris CM01]